MGDLEAMTHPRGVVAARCPQAAALFPEDVLGAGLMTGAERPYRGEPSREECSNLWLPNETFSLAEAALVYASHGLPIFPCAGKVPCTKRGCLDATADLEQVKAWWAARPNANIGLVMGGLRRWLALDVDGEEGRSTLRQLELEHGLLPSLTLRAITGGGGQHWVFVVPPDVVVRNRARVAPGLDVRTTGGYIIVAPSIHASGRRYSWHTAVTPAPIPAWLLSLVTKNQQQPRPAAAAPSGPGMVAPNALAHRQRWAQAALEGLAREVAQSPVGTRNNTLNRAAYRAGRLVGQGILDEGAARAALIAAGLAAGLDEREIMKVLR